jgi:hypothetical protein
VPRHRPGRCDPLTLFGEGDAEEVKTHDAVEVPDVGCSNPPPGGDGGRGDEPIVRADILPRSGELGPDAGVRTSGEQAERQRGERGQDCLDECFPAGAVFGGRTVHTMQQLGRRDGSYRDFFGLTQLLFQPLAYLGHSRGGRQAPYGAFKVDKDGGI